MADERNGVLFFRADEDSSHHPAVEALKKVSLGDVRFPFGFFLVDEDGKRHVIPATEGDRTKIVLKAYPEMSEEALRGYCLYVSGEGCRGGCPITHECSKIYEEESRYYGCACNPRI